MQNNYLIDETVQMIKWYNTIIYNCTDPKLKLFFEKEKELIIRSHKDHCENRRRTIIQFQQKKQTKSIEEALDQIHY